MKDTIYVILRKIAFAILLFLVLYHLNIVFQPHALSVTNDSADGQNTFIVPGNAYYITGSMLCYPGQVLNGTSVMNTNYPSKTISSLTEIVSPDCIVGDNYVATVKFRINAFNDINYSLFIPGEFCEYIVYSNGDRIVSTDEFDSDSPRYPAPRVVNLPMSSDGDYEIVINLITPTKSLFSTSATLLFGSSDRIRRSRSIALATSIVYIGIMIVLIASALLQYSMRKGSRRIASFILLCISQIVSGLVNSDRVIMEFFPKLPYEIGTIIKTMSMPLAILAVIYHAYCLYSNQLSSKLIIVVSTFFLIPVTYSLTLRTIPFLELASIATYVVGYFVCDYMFVKTSIKKAPYYNWFSYAILALNLEGLLVVTTKSMPVGVKYLHMLPMFFFSLIEIFNYANHHTEQIERERFYTEELTRTLEKMQASESAFLNAQMKPHFLYNTLNTIADLCVSDPDKARSLISSLTDYCKLIMSIDNMEKTVPLAQEMELVNAYTSIEHERFPSITFLTDSPVRMPRVDIPPLTLQPLIENAIKHGVRKSDKPGVITLRIRDSYDEVTFYVTDNGAGMNGETIQKLFREPKENKSIGVYNIDKRLKNLFNSGLTVESTIDVGTSICFTVPK